jgi:hypothetical protein
MATSPLEHAADTRMALREIVSEHGVAALSNPAIMSNLLRDLLPDAPQVTRLLVAAAEDRIAEVLAQHVAQGLDAAVAQRLAASSFASTTLFTPEICDWVVAEIAVAAGLGTVVGGGAGVDLGGQAETIVATIAPPGGPPPANPPPSSPPPSNQPATIQQADSGVTGPQEAIAAQTLGVTTPGDDVVRPLPLPGGRPKWLVPGGIAAVTVVALVAVLVAWSPWSPPPVLRPAGLAALGEGLSTVTFRWLGPATGPVPGKYDVLLGGNLIASVPGTTTTYHATGLAPGTSYQFQVVAVRDRTRSPKSAALQVSTDPTPPRSDAILEGDWQMDPSHGTWYGYASSPLPLSDETWSFLPDCSSGPCSVTLSGKFQGRPIKTTLVPHGGSYSGRARYSYPNPAGSCEPVTVGQLTIKININQAAVIGNTWQATSWTGTIIARVPANARCTAAGINASISSSQ